MEIKYKKEKTSIGYQRYNPNYVQYMVRGKYQPKCVRFIFVNELIEEGLINEFKINSP